MFRRLRARISKENVVSLEYAGRIMDQALAFLAACARTSRPLAPSETVDIGWHTFILYTHEYAEFCERISGSFIHHVPNDSDETGDVPLVDMMRRTTDAIRAAGFVVDDRRTDGCRGRDGFPGQRPELRFPGNAPDRARPLLRQGRPDWHTASAGAADGSTGRGPAELCCAASPLGSDRRRVARARIGNAHCHCARVRARSRCDTSASGRASGARRPATSRVPAALAALSLVDGPRSRGAGGRSSRTSRCRAAVPAACGSGRRSGHRP